MRRRSRTRHARSGRSMALVSHCGRRLTKARLFSVASRPRWRDVREPQIGGMRRG